MADVGLNVTHCLDWMVKQKPHPLRIVECGTIRNPTFEGHEDGLATYHIARWMKANEAKGHEFMSFELSHGAMVGTRQFLQDHGGLHRFVTFGLGDAALLLEHFVSPIDFCYLDAGADPVENLHQYRRAEKLMRVPGLIIIDDVFDPRIANRGIITVPYARMDGRKIGILNGRQALISFGADEVPLPRESVWMTT